jgi:hypothetical protein
VTPRLARFADRRVVTEVADREPSDVPHPTPPLEEVYLSEALLHRAFVVALNPAEIPMAGDVNALDEVPRSSWFSPGTAEPMKGPPELPLKVMRTRSERGPALAVVDARGLEYVLRFDPPDRPEMRTAAAMIAGALLRAVGYLTPESHIFHVQREALGGALADDVLKALAPPGPNGYRVVALRLPPGVDLGPTAPSTSRFDDPNDRVAHRDRRTLRALKAMAAWLAITRFDSHTLRDIYVGRSGAGHVRHYVAGLDGALGADAVVREADCDGERAAPSPWVRLVTLGLYQKRSLTPTSTECPSMGALSDDVDLDAFSTSFEPMSRALPGDLYWAAKRLAQLTEADLDAAVAAGQLSDPLSRARIHAAIARRKVSVIARGLSLVTPLEVVRLDGATIHARDEAVRLGYAASADARYEIQAVDDAGKRVGQPTLVRGTGADVAITLPAKALARGYAILHVTAIYKGQRAPRPVEIHLAATKTTPRVVGVRH